MAARTDIINNDHALVKLIVVTPLGIENPLVRQGESDSVSGPEGSTFTYAWWTKDDLIMDGQVNQYGATHPYGTPLVFGNPAGRIPG